MEKVGDPQWEIADGGLGVPTWGTIPRGQSTFLYLHANLTTGSSQGETTGLALGLHSPLTSPLGTPIPLCVTALTGYLDMGWGTGGSPEG